MKKKVLIVEPRSTTNVFSFYSYLPLMGPLYLGTMLKNAGFDVKVVNENMKKTGLSDSELDADFLLLTCLTPTVTRGYQIARRFKELNPAGKVLMGGPHVTFSKDAEQAMIDHIVEGEGENIVVDLLKYGSSEKIVKGSPVKNMDNLPLVDWDIYEGNERGKIMPIMTSRGCPFACNFCSVTEMFGRKYRAMSAERVMEEVKTLRKPFIFFYDDNLTANLKRAHEIMDGMIKLGVKPKTWTAQVRSDIANDPALVEKMARSGCDRVYIGFESINQKTLEKMKKSQTPEDISRAIATLHKHSISVHGMFIYGSDSDSMDVVKSTVDFVKSSHVDSVQYTVLTPFPGTEFFKKIESDGRLIHRDWEYYDGLHVVFWPENFTPLALQQQAIRAFESFYSFGSAANEMLNCFAKSAANLGNMLAAKGMGHTYSIRNALFKAGGKFIVNRWYKMNRSYMNYLYQLTGTAKVSGFPPCHGTGRE